MDKAQDDPTREPDADTPLGRLRQAAHDGDAQACFQLGQCYARGWNVAVDEAVAVRWYLNAAEQGHHEAAYRAAALHFRRPHDMPGGEQIFAALQDAAHAGHADSMALLGWCYQNGRGCEVNHRHAIRYYKQGAAAGSAAARYNLGLCYLRGACGVEDVSCGMRLLEQAAHQGHVRAQLNLGRALAEGRGLARDIDAACRWYRLAAESGYAKAQYNLGLILLGGEVAVDDDSVGADWVRQAAEQGLVKAQFTLASLYRRGLGVERDPGAATQWLQQAAEAGYSKAQYQLGRLLCAGKEIARNATQGRHWLSLAAESGLAQAQYALGRELLREGAGHEAFAWFQRAARQQHARALFNAGVCYSRGIGVAMDKVMAYRYFERAAAGGSRGAAGALQKLARKLDAASLARARRARPEDL